LELAALGAVWPAQRLVQIWNDLPGVHAVKRFENREVGVHRIWKRWQNGRASQKPPEVPVAVGACSPDCDLLATGVVENAAVPAKTVSGLPPTIAGAGSRAEAMLNLLRRSEAR
jgi:hypothetical protein